MTRTLFSGLAVVLGVHCGAAQGGEGATPQPATPSATARTASATALPDPPAPTSTAAPDEAPLFADLRSAHRSRDAGAVRDAEAAILARGLELLPNLREAFERERSFLVKVSLQFIIRRLEGHDSAREIVDAMRACRAADEKMRHAFTLMKVDRATEVPYLAHAATSELDPMIKRYCAQALGNLGADGLEALGRIAQADSDRHLRFEAIRLIEERGSAASEGVLLTIARDDPDSSMQSVAIRALARLGGSACRSFFTHALEEERPTNHRFQATTYFARAGEPEDMNLLEGAHATERVEAVRRRIRLAIDAIRRRSEGATEEPPQEPLAPLDGR